MKRILRLSTLASAIALAVLLPSLALPQAANAGPPYSGYYYGGGYAQGYGVNSGYGYSPYGYTYVGPRVYVRHSYQSYSMFGRSNAGYFGTQNFGGPSPYGQRYRPGYNPYGYGGSGAYGY